MAAKNSKDNNELEPITIDTTILKINIKTTGDLKTKDYDLLPFHPNMSDLRDLSDNSYILFPSFVKITMKDLQKAGVGSDYPKVFMNLDKYIKLIRYVTNPNKEEDNTLLTNNTQIKNYSASLLQHGIADLIGDSTVDTISIQKDEHLTDEEIITNNIELIKSLFLANKSHFFILGNDYVIGESKFVPPYVPSNEINERLSNEVKKIPLNYTITIELRLLDAANNPEAGDFMKMTCKAKKGNIAKDMKDIFGFNFGYVPEVRSPIPSILNTTEATKNRQYGKLQLEWEKRNKYVKAPANERERLALEKNWTPLQRKMSEYDKQQDAYNKIPPMWIKAREEIDKKYTILTAELVKLWGEINDIKQSNKDNPGGNSFTQDQLSDVRTKIYRLVEPLMSLKTTAEANRALADGLNKSDITFTELRAKLDEYTKTKTELETASTEKGVSANYEKELNKLAEQIAQLKSVNDFINPLENSTSKDAAETTIKNDLNKKDGFLGRFRAGENAVNDDKYTAALFEGTKHEELKGDLKVLEKDEQAIYEKLKTADPYNAASIKADLAKVQANIRRKKADIGVLDRKYNKDEMIRKWVDTLNKMSSIKKTIESEKTKDEKTIANKTVKDEMKKLFDKEIKKLKEEYLIASFKEGNEDNVTKSEREKFEKKDRPIESAADIKTNLDNIKTQYLEIAGKLGFFEKIQAEITLLNDDMAHIKELKTSNEGEKKKIDDKMREISTELGRIGNSNMDRTKTLKLEQETLQEESTKKNFEQKIKKFKKKEEDYKDYIKKIKGIPNNKEAKNNYKNILEGTNEKGEKYYDIIKTTLKVDQAGGGKNSLKRKEKKKKRKTKRLVKRSLGKKRTLRRKKQRRRKYTK